ncbi:hypothetical protein F5B20DRAFT_566547 [Whalleya microplaca]|nr:hypothetical protein F5B20DRAFT_566547 [Whalleya microplaca]
MSSSSDTMTPRISFIQFVLLLICLFSPFAVQAQGDIITPLPSNQQFARALQNGIESPATTRQGYIDSLLYNTRNAFPQDS